MSQHITRQLAENVISMAIVRPCYRVYDAFTETPEGKFKPGVYFHTTRNARDGTTANIDDWICSPLYVDAITSCEGQNYGKLLRFVDPAGRWRELPVPMRLFSGNGDDVRAELLDSGVNICPNSHRKLTAYISSQQPARHMVATSKTGWYSDAVFVMPTKTLGQEEEVVFQAVSATQQDYVSGGTLAEWSSTIGTLCQGNPVALFAISSALAGPLLKPLGKGGGGFHFIGDSSCGKTTLMVMAGSVWGKGDNFVGTWRATGNGLEGVAVSRNDTCMILDEISESSSKDVGAIVYAIANGHGKLRANRSGFARTPQHWRLLMLSSGERGLAAHMAESGTSIKAGQEVRLPDVPVTRAHGVFDHLHGYQSGSEFSDYLKWTSNKYYGHAGPTFIEKLIDSPERGQLRAMHDKLHSAFDTDGGQEKRTADRFAVSALAGELAIQFGLLPLQEGAAMAAARVLFNAWKENRGAGDSEPRQILRAVSDFVSRHSESRFSCLSSEERHHVRDRAGWWKDNDANRLYLFTNEGLKDATRGHDFRRAKQALDAAGWIAERDGNRFDKATWVLGRTQRLFYVTIQELQE